MYIPEDIVKVIKERAVLLEVIGEFTGLKKKGKDFVGECPFCNVSKFSVTPAKDIYKCWSCEKGGNNVLTFLMDKQNLTYPEALKWLADFYKIIIPEPDEKTKSKPAVQRSKA